MSRRVTYLSLGGMTAKVWGYPSDLTDDSPTHFAGMCTCGWTTDGRITHKEARVATEEHEHLPKKRKR